VNTFEQPKLLRVYLDENPNGKVCVYCRERNDEGTVYAHHTCWRKMSRKVHDMLEGLKRYYDNSDRCYIVIPEDMDFGAGDSD